MGALVTGVQTCALPISAGGSCHRLEAEQKGQSAVPLTMISLRAGFLHLGGTMGRPHPLDGAAGRSEEHTSELQSLMRSSYAGFCWKKKKRRTEGQRDHTDREREGGRRRVACETRGKG